MVLWVRGFKMKQQGGEIMNKKKIGDKLIALRGNKTKEQVCFELGISFSALNSYEAGVRVPKDEIKIKIANYYHTTVASIFFD